MKLYTLRGGRAVVAASKEEFVIELRRMSFNPCESLEEFIDATANACKVQTGAIVSSYDIDSFVTDLEANGFISVSELH